MNVLVTGASGFLGKYVVEELLRRKHHVRVFVRSKERIEKLDWANDVVAVEGDLLSHENFSSLFDNIDALIHLAACKNGDKETQYNSTVIGTDRLLKAMKESQTKRLILISSLSVYDYHSLETELTEETLLESNLNQRDGYAIAKACQEQLVRRYSDENGWELTVLRPGFIWGEVHEYPLVLGIPLGYAHFIVGPMKAPNLTHVKNCADAIVTCLEKKESVGQTFNVIDQWDIGAWNFMGNFLEVIGKKGMRIPIPYDIANGMIRLIYKVSRFLLGDNQKIPSLFVPCRFEARFKPFLSQNPKIQKILGWIPPLSLKECFALYRKDDE